MRGAPASDFEHREAQDCFSRGLKISKLRTAHARKCDGLTIMSTGFHLHADPAVSTGDFMSSASNTIKNALAGTGSAANADQLGDQATRNAQRAAVEATGGWDAYEVWRRFIKDPRDRRGQQD